MSAPGWYPDPAGAPGQFRYWDGSAWGETTTPDPGREQPPASKPGRRNTSVVPIVVATVLVMLVALFLWMLLGDRVSPQYTPASPDTNSAAPTVSGWDETSRPTPPPTDLGDLVACPYSLNNDRSPQYNDRLVGGGLAVDRISGWHDDTMYLDWVTDFHVQTDQVRPGWISNIGVGQVNAEDGFTDPGTAARQTIECFSTTSYYQYFTHRVDQVNEATSVDGHYAWHMRSEIHIDNPSMPEIDGDLVDVYVVDIGDPERMGIFVSSVTIGDTARQAKVDAAIASLRVED